MKSRLSGLTLFVLLTLTFVAPGYAATVSFHATCDDGFHMYLSTDPYGPGTGIGAGDNWGTTLSDSSTLFNAPVQYLLILIHGDYWGGPAIFIGDFTLDSPSFHFANGTQSLVTNVSDWYVSASGYNLSPNVVTDYGLNGVGPRGYLPAINANAHWIWTDDYFGVQAYLSTPIYSSVPLPPALLLLGSGLLALAGWRKLS